MAWTRPALVLLPNLINEKDRWQDCLSGSIDSVVKSLDGLFVESEKVARKYLRFFLSHEEMQTKPLHLLNEHTKKEEWQTLFSLIKEEQRWGILSDCGLCCLADPGSCLVNLAYKNKVHVEVYPGPSSIIMALQLSGFSAQRFSFHGYLPRENFFCQKLLKAFEVSLKHSTQLWMETPYRTDKMIALVLQTLHPQTIFCVIYDIGMHSYKMIKETIAKWPKNVSIGKKPAIFLIGENN